MAPKFMESDAAEIEDVLMGQATKANEANKTNPAYEADQIYVYDIGQGTRQPFIMLTGIYGRWSLCAGASSINLSKGIKLFASDFEYGLGTADPRTFRVFLIYSSPKIPILLSH